MERSLQVDDYDIMNRKIKIDINVDMMIININCYNK